MLAVVPGFKQVQTKNNVSVVLVFVVSFPLGFRFVLNTQTDRQTTGHKIWWNLVHTLVEDVQNGSTDLLIIS